MSVLVVGSVALDSVETPFGRADRVLGGSANYFAAAASLFGTVRVVGVVGDDYPLNDLDFLRARGVDFSGLEMAPGSSFFWEGRYHYDLNSRDTVTTELGVFADFEPRIPEEFLDSRFVFLGNIDPVLQMKVLEQVREPELVVCDTMNYWIEGSRRELEAVLARVDILMVNDEEIRQLAGEPNLLKASRWAQAKGPEHVIVKKGEHGAILFAPDWIFFAPGFPLEDVFDPTGAGDAFAGGFIGHLMRSDTVDREQLRRAMMYGSSAGSYSVESFSIDRFRDLSLDDLFQRVESFRDMTAFLTEDEKSETRNHPADPAPTTSEVPVHG